jgi:Zn finger protein HypA/HybF involved in hydrogenase expression
MLTTYLAIYCKNCNRHFMSTSINNFKCSFCGSKNGSIMYENNNSKIISTYIKQANIPQHMRS